MSRVNKISIISTTYNNWRMLRSAIESVKAQVSLGGFDVEYIIIDDGTLDFDMKYVESMLTDFPFKVKVIVNDYNMGSVKSFNRAVKLAHGDIIIPLAADDSFYDSEVVFEIASVFIRTGTLILTGVRVPLINGVESEELPFKSQRDLFLDQNKLLKYITLNGNIISGACTYYHKDVFKEVGYFDERYRLLEDYPFYLKSLSGGVAIDFYPIKCIRYHLGGISNAKSMRPDLASDFKLASSESLKLVPLNALEKKVVEFKFLLTKKQKIRYLYKHIDSILYIIARSLIK